MTGFDESQVRRGQPANAGQFRAKSNTAPVDGLAADDMVLPDHSAAVAAYEMPRPEDLETVTAAADEQIARRGWPVKLSDREVAHILDPDRLARQARREAILRAPERMREAGLVHPVHAAVERQWTPKREAFFRRELARAQSLRSRLERGSFWARIQLIGLGDHWTRRGAADWLAAREHALSRAIETRGLSDNILVRNAYTDIGRTDLV